MIKEYFIKILQKYASEGLVLFIDLVIVSISFILSYFIYTKLTVNFNVNKFLVQLAVIDLIALIAFIITGSYKGIGQNMGNQTVYAIFNAICLSSILIIVVAICNGLFQIEDGFSKPLSVIIIQSLISFVSLFASRYSFKALFPDYFPHKYKKTKNMFKVSDLRPGRKLSEELFASCKNTVPNYHKKNDNNFDNKPFMKVVQS